MKISTKEGFFWLFILCFVACYAQFVNKSFAFEPYYSLYSDATCLYPLQHLSDPTLFNKDPLASQVVKNVSFLNIQFAFFPIYQVLLRNLSLPLAVKVVPIILCVLATLVMYRWARRLFSFGYARFFSGVFLLYCLSMDSFFSGSGRCFGIFLYVCFIFFLSKDKLLPALACVLFSSFVYISIAPCMFLTYVFYFLDLKYRHFSWKRNWPYIILFLVAILFVVEKISRSAYCSNILNSLSDLQTYKLYLRTAAPVQTSDPVAVFLYFVLNLHEHSILYKYITLLLLLCSGLVLFTVKKCWLLPKLAWLMLLGSGLCFLVIFPFHPTTASRQFVFTLPIFLLIFIFVNTYTVIKDKKANTDFWLVLLILAFLIAHPLLNNVHSFRQYKPIYDYLGALPKDILIAGSTKSRLMRTIPFFAKRPVYYSEKMRDLWRIFFSSEFIKRRRQNVLEAMYAETLGPVRKFIAENDVDLFIVESKYYANTPDSELMVTGNTDETQVYAFIQERLGRKNFALLSFAEAHYDFVTEIQGNRVYIISAEKIISARP